MGKIILSCNLCIYGKSRFLIFKNLKFYIYERVNDWIYMALPKKIIWIFYQCLIGLHMWKCVRMNSAHQILTFPKKNYFFMLILMKVGKDLIIRRAFLTFYVHFMEKELWKELWIWKNYYQILTKKRFSLIYKVIRK